VADTATPTSAAPTSEAGTASATPTAAGPSVDAVVASLNEVYAELEPALETLEVAELDFDALEARVRQVQRDIASLQEAGDAEETRLQSLSDTRWVFDRLVRTFVRFDDAYALHEVLREAYAASETTDEATTALARLETRASEAASAVQAAVSRYDSMDDFDPALDVSREAFRRPLFRVSDTANALAPLAQGLERAVPAREGYRESAATYEAGDYREARDAFDELLNRFTDAREWFERADRMAGPLGPAREQYQCEARAGRLACVEYRAACREQRDGNPDRAERRRQQARQRYQECG
jgi:TolA-binding protein